MSEENRGAHKLYKREKIGGMQTADEVVTITVGLTATKVEDVNSTVGSITSELVDRLGVKSLSKGVKMDVMEEHMLVDLPPNIRYGYNTPSVSEQVQEKVDMVTENMTGLTVLDVNIKIAGVNMDEGRQNHGLIQYL